MQWICISITFIVSMAFSEHNNNTRFGISNDGHWRKEEKDKEILINHERALCMGINIQMTMSFVFQFEIHSSSSSSKFSLSLFCTKTHFINDIKTMMVNWHWMLTLRKGGVDGMLYYTTSVSHFHRSLSQQPASQTA